MIVFNGFEDIEARFVTFWELLSKASVETNSLQRAFSDGSTAGFQYRRVADHLHEFREKVSRNRLAPNLERILAEFMGEISDEHAKDKLKQLYVNSKELESVLHSVGQRISMSLSESVRLTGRVVEPSTRVDLRASVEREFKKHLSIPKRGDVLILLGRVGSGKTTFVTHFLRIGFASVMSHHLPIVFDFRLLEKGGSVRAFFYEQLRSVLSKNERFTSLSSKQLRQIYASEIRELTIGPLAHIERNNKKLYEEKIAEFLLQRFRDSESHYPRVLRYLADKIGVRCFFVFDNVDQHDFNLQQEIFQFAHSVADRCHAFAIVTMWEETYFRSKQSGGALSAYQSVAYALPPVSVVDIVSRRLQYVVEDIQRGGLALQLMPTDDQKDDVTDFLGLVRQSILHDQKRARHFLESISMGHLRKAMEIFSLFLVSGHTDASKMLTIYRGAHSYLIPLHEFIKSIGLGDNKYYHSELSVVLNLFSISDESRPSHFTKMRLLEYLYYHRNHSTSYGMGFIRADLIHQEFKKIGTSESDIIESLRILSSNLLLENDLYDRSNPGKAYRITGAGRYYLRYLSNKFSYLDLVCQDTPIADRSVCDLIKDNVNRKELDDRFRRVAAFLNYLLGEEEREFAAILNVSDSMPLRQKLIPGLKESFEQDRRYIVSRKGRARRAAAAQTPYEVKEESSEVADAD